MLDEIKGYVTWFIVVPLTIGAVWYGGYRAVTGKWPNVPIVDCYRDWDGRANPSVCD